MKRMKEVINLFKNKETIKNYNLTEIEVLSYIYLIWNQKLNLLAMTQALIYPNKEIRIKHRSYSPSINDQEKNEENELWKFIFYVECIGKNLDELKKYVEDNFKESINFISICTLFDDSERLSVGFTIRFERLKYL